VTTRQLPADSDPRFAFGENWSDFAELVDPRRSSSAPVRQILDFTPVNQRGRIELLSSSSALEKLRDCGHYNGASGSAGTGTAGELRSTSSGWRPLHHT